VSWVWRVEKLGISIWEISNENALARQSNVGITNVSENNYFHKQKQEPPQCFSQDTLLFSSTIHMTTFFVVKARKNLCIFYTFQS